MKFAVVNGQHHQEAQPDLAGNCPACGHELVAKCGAVKIWHWAHRGSRRCDPWWENETEWHRAWKGQFPVEWQEIVHSAENGEKHIADVRTDHGWVIEFQHSHIAPEERRSRETFYPKLVWVVNGLRRTRDRVQFLNALESGVRLGANSTVRKVFTDECALLREWAGSPVPIFCDFGDEQMLWWLLNWSSGGMVYVAPFPRAVFIGVHRGGSKEAARVFDEFVKDLGKLIAGYESQPRQGFQQFVFHPSRRRRL